MRGILGSQWRRYRLHLKTKHQEHILNVKSELKSPQISSTDTENVIGGELVRVKYSDETIETRRGSLRDENYACEQALMVSREGGLFPPPPLTSMVGHFGRSVLVRIHIRAVFFLVRQCLHYTEELFVSTQKAIRYTVNTIRYVTLQFTDPRGADSLSQRNRVEITVLMCEQNPCPVWFFCRRKSYAVYCEHCLSFPISVFYVLFFPKI